MKLKTALQQVSLFEALSDEVLQRLARVGQVETVAKGAVICAEGERSTHMFVVLLGGARVVRQTGQTAVHLATLGEGDFFGELAMFDGQARSATVVADPDATVFKLGRAAFLEMLSSSASAEVTAEVIAGLVRRVRESTGQLVEKELQRRTLETQMDAERHRVMAEMLAGLAHEINTPLGVANTGASILQGRLALPVVTEALESAGEEGRYALEDMAEAAALTQKNLQRAHQLVETFKRVSVDHFVDERASVSLSELLQNVVDLFRLHARQTALEVQLDDGLPAGAQWQGYPGHLTQALTNLLFNAERHGYPDGGGTVHLAARVGADGYVITVRDAGRGISPEVQPRIFEPFFTTARMQGGAGLGLAIVRNVVVEALAGTIEVTSTVDVGTTFTIRVPTSVPEKAATPSG